jgi:chromosome segregation ATPase
MVCDREAQFSRSREIESALRTELEEAKADLARTVGDERTVSERLLKAEAQLDEKRKVLEEMLFEMGALEEERDQAVRMVQMLTLKDKERQKEFDDVRQQFSEMQRTLDESKVEEERLTDEWMKVQLSILGCYAANRNYQRTGHPSARCRTSEPGTG